MKKWAHSSPEYPPYKGMGDEYAKMVSRPAEPVWQQYSQWLQRYLVRCLRHHDRDTARDLAQEVYLRLLRVEKGEPVRNYQAYLYRIASHVVYEFKLRARQEVVNFDSESLEEWDRHPTTFAADPVGECVGNQQEVETALAQLHPTARAVLLLHKRDGLAYTEVAEQLGMSVNMVHKHLTRALAALRAARWER